MVSPGTSVHQSKDVHEFYSLALLWSDRKETSNLPRHACLNVKNCHKEEGLVASTSRSVVWKLVGEAVGRGESNEVCRGTRENLWVTGFEFGSERVIASCLEIFTDAP